VKTNVYVDGFNLYYGAVKGTPHKWLDIRKYCELAFPRHTIAEIHYCTAIVKDAEWDPQQSLRQRTFIRALETTGVIVHYGSFQSNRTMMPSARPPKEGHRGPQMLEVIKTEEKGSDVALGALLVHHAHQGRFEAAIVLSNDSDLVLPIKIVTQELHLPVGILNPHKKFAAELGKVASFKKMMRAGVIEAAQLPDELKDKHGTITKPERWR
jgi:hypothetical protein